MFTARPKTLPVQIWKIAIHMPTRITVVRRAAASMAALLVLILAAPLARSAVPVERHELRCDENFPCHDEIRRRTDFWIQVYGQWTSAKGIFHDSLHPERVYSVIDVPNGCRGNSRVVERERERIESRLRTVARKVQDGGRVGGGEEAALLELFPDRSPKSIRAAARRIRCQQGNRDRFEDALRRYGSYGPMVRKLINDAGLPDDVHYLPFVESLYNPAAYSRVGAAGLWQIMPKTARYLGLELNATVDERLDMEAATLAAVRYLEDSRRRLTAVARNRKPSVRAGELGPFVITSYNYGVNGMRRALDEFGPDFIKVLNEYKSPSFQVAVKNFYASFLAARHVARNAARFFGDVPADPPLRYHTVVLEHDTSMKRILDVFDVNESELKDLNRALTRFVWHGWRFAPKGYRLRLPYRENGWSRQEARLAALGPESDERGPVNYTVRRGDTACGIARAFHVKCRDLIDMNRLGKRAFIRVGQVLVIPGKLGGVGGTRTVASIEPGGNYRVRPGDSPCGIASRAGLSCQVLLAANSLTRRSVIHPGQVLKLPGGSDGTVKGDTAPAKPVDATPASYTVKKGDTACEIAQRFSVSCDEMLALNGMSKRSVLSIGKVLALPGEGRDRRLGAVPGPGEFEDVAYTVRPGDTPCQIAERYEMDCPDFQRINNLRPHSVIYVGQTLKVRTRAAEGAAAAAVAARVRSDAGDVADGDTAGEAAASPLDSDLDLEIVTRQVRDGYRHYIVVESDETLGHYADWLGIGSVSAIKELNGIGVNELIAIGTELRLPVTTDEQKTRFDQKRSEYHRVLVEEFKENYRVSTVDNYEVRVGDSAWKVADRFQLPLWVLTRYNPELRARNPLVGETLKVPRVESRG